jgi:small subunit ribosomal protein S6
MNKYELLLILSASNEEGDKDALIEKITKLLENKGAKVESVDKWGNKKLAYPINYKDTGYYVLMNIEAPANVPAEVQLQLNITQDVVRASFVRKR